MPKINFEKVISFSSEDHVHTANNLLNNDPTKKWKCKSPGEKSASVELQLEKPTVISNIDIGNEHSAYIEVLVNRSTSSQDYKGLLVMSSFMSPIESRQSTNVNKVRMFSGDQLTKPECDEKWDRIKVICTQPFNRHVQYGISFITLHSIEDKTSTLLNTSTNIGKFLLRPESPDNISVGSLFAKQKDKTAKVDDNPVKAATAIREASSSPVTVNKRPSLFKELSKNLSNKKQATTSSDNSKTSLRNRDEILCADDEIAPNAKIDAIMNKKNEESKKRKINDESTAKNSVQKKVKKVLDEANVNSIKDVPSTSKHEKRNPNTPKKENAQPHKKTLTPRSKNKNQKPFNELLNHVTFVISGIENPERARIRTFALEMGATYKANWDNICTHLICAFANTPKFNQVKGKGKIVTRKWIEDCHSERKRIPWRKYALEKSERGKDESEDEILELVETNLTDESEDNNENDKKSGSDTEDEIERIQNQQNNQSQSVYDQDTDTECVNGQSESPNTFENFPDLFNSKWFYIDDKLSDDEKKILIQHIFAYNGHIAQTLSENIDIIITNGTYLQDIKSKKSNCQFLPPDWIWKCHNEQKYVSTDEFEL